MKKKRKKNTCRTNQPQSFHLLLQRSWTSRRRRAAGRARARWTRAAPASSSCPWWRSGCAPCPAPRSSGPIRADRSSSRRRRPRPQRPRPPNISTCSNSSTDISAEASNNQHNNSSHSSSQQPTLKTESCRTREYIYNTQAITLTSIDWGRTALVHVHLIHHADTHEKPHTHTHTSADLRTIASNDIRMFPPVSVIVSRANRIAILYCCHYF